MRNDRREQASNNNTIVSATHKHTNEYSANDTPNHAKTQTDRDYTDPIHRSTTFANHNRYNTCKQTQQ